MVSGTDEHGTPITLAADREGVGPREIADRYSGVISQDLQRLGLSYDLFTRTTTRNHYAVVQDIFKALYDRGYLIQSEALGAFSSTTGRTLPDRYIEGTCPTCGFTDARGDQCDNCGNQLDPTDLIGPRSKIDGTVPIFKTTEHFFLDLPAFAQELAGWIGAHEQWRPNVRGFALNLVKDLHPRAVTRDIDWGVPIPLPAYEGRPDKRIYVWFDAVIGYLSASIEWAKSTGDPEAWRQWWQNEQAKHFYFMGKDNIVFHSVIWPALLLGLRDTFGPALHLPDNIVSSEYLTMEGHKFSTSRNVAIYVRDFLARYDADALRYYLSAGGPEVQDADFTWSDFVRRNNDELVATWGNLANRVLTLSYKHFGAVPQPGALLSEDLRLIADAEGGFRSVGEHIEGARFRAAIAEAMRLATLVNGYLTVQEPWQLLSRDRERAGTVLYVALRCIDNLKILFTPFLPFTSQALHEMLGYTGVIAELPELGQRNSDDPHVVLTTDHRGTVGHWGPSALPARQPLRTPRALFRKLDDSIVTEELGRMEREAGISR